MHNRAEASGRAAVRAELVDSHSAPADRRPWPACPRWPPAAAAPPALLARHCTGAPACGIRSAVHGAEVHLMCYRGFRQQCHLVRPRMLWRWERGCSYGTAHHADSGVARYSRVPKSVHCLWMQCPQYLGCLRLVWLRLRRLVGAAAARLPGVADALHGLRHRRHLRTAATSRLRATSITG